MIYLLFDASAIVPFYDPISREQIDIVAGLTARKLDDKLFFYIPVFCISEVLNTFAKRHYRLKKLPADLYQKCRNDFIKHVKDRNFFYCYYMNRYHNINAHEVFLKEHTVHTEYSESGLDPLKVRPYKVERALRKKDPTNGIYKYYLSTFDIVIISMAMELQKIHGEAVIVTADNRIETIASAIGGIEVLNYNKGKEVFDNFFYKRRL